MAAFIFGNKLFKRIKHHRLLRSIIWTIEWWVVASLMALLRCMPMTTASNVGCRLGRWLGPHTHKHTVIKHNIQRVFPGKSEEAYQVILRDIWGNAGRVFAEYPHLHEIIAEHLTIDVLGDVEAFSNPQKSAVFVAAHYSNWELLGAVVPQKGGLLTCMEGRFLNPRLNRMLTKYRSALGCSFVSKKVSAKRLAQVIKQHHSLGFIIDQRIKNGISLAFAGVQKPSTLVPAKLALRYGCQFIVVCMVRTAEHDYKAIVYPPIKPSRSSVTKKDKAIDMTLQAHAIFEKHIRDDPGCWFCPKSNLSKNNPPNSTESLSS